MKLNLKVKILIAFILALALMGPTVRASGPDSLPLANDTADLLPLPPLDTLIAWALMNSPVLKGQDALIEKNSADTRRVKKQLLDILKLNTGIQYGNYGDPLVNRLSTGYNTGAGISFSLYQLFGWKNQVQVYNAEKQVSVYKKDELVMDLKKMVILLFNDTRGQKGILKIRSDGSYSAFSHMKMAEKEFNEGSIEVGELSRVTEIFTKAQVDYEQCVNDLKNDYMQLELLVGVPLKSYKQ